MSETRRPTPPETVNCEVCLKEIPASEAESQEAVEYVLYFCGLECHAKWREQHFRPDKPSP